MTKPPKIKSIDELLSASQASQAFKEAVRQLSAGKHEPDRIGFDATLPGVKVLRMIMKLLDVRPDLPIERVSIQAVSGCSNFTGRARIEPGEGKATFNWDCRWQAEQMGWSDAVGMPDQIRAARELGYQCFEAFEIAGV